MIGIGNQGIVIEIDQWTPEANVTINEDIIKVNGMSYKPNKDEEHEIIIKFTKK